MGTRSLTRVFDEHTGQALCCLYGQYDGFPDSHGKELAELLTTLKMVNGLGDRSVPVANGAGCLAAQIVAHFKDQVGAGGFYLYPIDSAPEEYNYEVRPQGAGKPVLLKVLSGTEVEWEGEAQNFLVWLENT